MIADYRGDAAETMQKAPSTNIQAPEKLQISNIKNPLRRLGGWSLRFLWSLALGTWMFNPSCPRHTSIPTA
jgi:hypothetical protein